MAYTRTQWVEQETPLSAQNMNNIEDGIEELQSTKVDKATGKGLSDQNYTATEKTKLAGIETGAQVNPGVATTSANGLMSAADKTKLDGVQAGAQVNPSNATESTAGLMSAADKTKLNNTPEILMQNAIGGLSHINDDELAIKFNAPFSVASQKSGTPGAIRTTEVVSLPDATTSSSGAMSAADKTRLDSIVRPYVASSRAAVTVQPKLSAEIIYDIPVETVGEGYTSAVLEGIVLPDGLCIGNIQRTASGGSITAIKVTVTNASGNTRTVPQHSRAMVLLVKGV